MLLGEGLDFTEVAKELDQPWAGYRVAEVGHLRSLAALFARASGTPLLDAAPHLLSAPWPRHPKSHLAFLEAALNDATLALGAPRESAANSGESLLPGVARFEDGSCSNGPAHGGWLNPNLVKVVLDLGEGQGAECGAQARALLDRGAHECPEALMLCLVALEQDARQTKGPTKGPTTAQGLGQALERDLVPLFFAADGRRARQGALPLAQRVWGAGAPGASGPRKVLQWCRRAYARSPSAATVHHLVSLVRQLPGGAKQLTEPRAGNRELALAAACALGDRGELDLEAWCTERINGSGAHEPVSDPEDPSDVDGGVTMGRHATEAALTFVARHALRAQPRPAGVAGGDAMSAALALGAGPGGGGGGCPLTVESLAALLRVLDKCSSPVPELAQRIEVHLGAPRSPARPRPTPQARGPHPSSGGASGGSSAPASGLASGGGASSGQVAPHGGQRRRKPGSRGGGARSGWGQGGGGWRRWWVEWLGRHRGDGQLILPKDLHVGAVHRGGDRDAQALQELEQAAGAGDLRVHDPQPL